MDYARQLIGSWLTAERLSAGLLAVVAIWHHCRTKRYLKEALRRSNARSLQAQHETQKMLFELFVNAPPHLASNWRTDNER